MVDIVIVNWNSGNFLKSCLKSIFTSGNQQLLGKVIVVDNCSGDGSANDLSANIIVVANQQNLGFSKACNQGFKLCTSRYVLLLNPDAQLMKDTLKDCVDLMSARTEIDILGCRLLDDDGKPTFSCSRFPSAKRIFFDASGLSKLAPKVFRPATLMTDWDHNESRFVDMVMGAFMFMKIELFETIQYFDERFFVYYEEVDFSRRLANVGGKTFYCSSIFAIHSGEGTTSSVKAFRLFLVLQSRLQYAKKHFSSAGYGLVWFSTFFIEPFCRMAFALARGKIKETGQILQGMKMLIKGYNAKGA